MSFLLPSLWSIWFDYGILLPVERKKESIREYVAVFNLADFGCGCLVVFIGYTGNGIARSKTVLLRNAGAVSGWQCDVGWGTFDQKFIGSIAVGTALPL